MLEVRHKSERRVLVVQRAGGEKKRPRASFTHF